MRAAVLTLAAMLAASPTFANSSITIINGDGPNEGYNDPTPVAPLANNAGTTLGQQRLNAFRYAAEIWASKLDSPVEIRVLTRFDPLGCTATSATLAGANATVRHANFFGETLPAFEGPLEANLWHHAALADKRAGVDLFPSDPSVPGVPFPDLLVVFNTNLGLPNCFAGGFFYYGTDTNEPAGLTNMVGVALHEMGHGLGFSQFAALSTGLQTLGFADVYNRNLLDTATGKPWTAMTDAERVASAVNPRHVVWTGANVSAAVPNVLALGTPLLNVTAPAAIAGSYQVGTAAFGAAITAPGLSGDIVQAVDAANAVGPTTFDGCTPLTNAAELLGKIALVDRGTCGFIVKAQNVQAAGAIAMIVADNAPGDPPAALGGTDPTIVIPAVRITLADGNRIKSALAAGVQGVLGVDLTRRAGADEQERIYVNSPNPLVQGSSISHWDPLTFPNQLMEPANNADLTHSVEPPQDLTLMQMRDVGWYADADVDGVADAADACAAGRDGRPTVVVGGVDTGVPNTAFTNGCTIQDLVNREAQSAANHGDFVSGITHLVNGLREAGIIDTAQRKAIHGAASTSAVGQ